jgi:hypothetical protein
MRLNAQEMKSKDLLSYSIRNYNGDNIPFCSIVDTDEGYAICHFAVPSRFKTEDELLKKTPLFSRDLETEEYTTHAYTLHSFMLYKDGELVAKV